MINGANNMTFEEAVRVVEDYAAGFGIKRGLLLDGLQLIRSDLAIEDEDVPLMVTQKQVTAYHIVCREMRKLF